MFLSGFADEAGNSLATQIKAIKTLGWDFIELRNVEGKNLASFDQAEFEFLQKSLHEAKLRINCFGSPVANWSRQARSEEDFQKDLNDLNSALPRMQKLGIKLIRGMSYVPASDEEPDNPELEQIIFRKVKELVQRCADAGIVYGHENCRNYGGMSWQHTLKLLEAVNHENLKLIFDTGNPVFTLRRMENRRIIHSRHKNSTAKSRAYNYVHIKDGTALINERRTGNHILFRRRRRR